MMKRLEMIGEIKKRYGILPIIIEIFRVITKAVALIYNFALSFCGVILWRAGATCSSLILLLGSVVIYIFALKDHSEDKIYEWCVKKYHSADNLLITTAVLYSATVGLQTLVLVVARLLRNI